jgi:hypothetical protein
VATFLQPLSPSYPDRVEQHRTWCRRFPDGLFEYEDELSEDELSSFMEDVMFGLLDDALDCRLPLQLAGIPEEFVSCIFDISHGVRSDWKLDMGDWYSDIDRQLVQGLCHLGLDVETTIAMDTLRAAWMRNVICLQRNHAKKTD